MKRMTILTIIGIIGFGVLTIAHSKSKAETLRQVDIEAKFLEISKKDTDILSAPRIRTIAGVNAMIEVVEEIDCPDGSKDKAGVILNVTPMILKDNIKLSGYVMISTRPKSNTSKQTKPNTEWLALDQLKVYFYHEMKKEKNFEIGPIAHNNKSYKFLISAEEVLSDGTPVKSSEK